MCTRRLFYSGKYSKLIRLKYFAKRGCEWIRRNKWRVSIFCNRLPTFSLDVRGGVAGLHRRARHQVGLRAEQGMARSQEVLQALSGRLEASNGRTRGQTVRAACGGRKKDGGAEDACDWDVLRAAAPTRAVCWGNRATLFGESYACGLLEKLSHVARICN